MTGPAVPTPGRGAMDATEEVRREWARRVQAEYRSAALTQHFTLWLMQLGAPPDLLDAGLRIVGDELVHAELSNGVYVAAGGGSDQPPLARASLRLPHVPEAELEVAVLLHGVHIFCLGETVAVRLFNRLRERCSVPVARKALDRILKDESFHRDFGWELLDWLMSTDANPMFRTILARDLGSLVASVRADYAQEGPVGGDVAEPLRAWGLMGPALYREAFLESLDKDYRPRFAAHGIVLESPEI